MSITFWCPDAPTTRTVPYPEQPDFVTEQSTLPELNLSNINAWALLRAAGLEPDYCGTWEVKDLPAIRAALIRLINTPATLDGYARPTAELPRSRRREVVDGVTHITSGPRMIDCGLSAAGLQDRAARLLEVLSAAAEHNYAVAWG